MSFETLGLGEALVRAVADAGYTEPTAIQREAIPAVLAGGDLLAGAQTGTGKTASFVLPILERLHRTGDAPQEGGRRNGRRIRALILAPTRELAAQVEQSVREYGKYSPLQSLAVFGGVSINPQIDRLRRGVDILVATPGRLLDHHSQRTIDLSGIEVLVLDEADRMLDMGFIHDIRRVLAILPKKRQSLLFSATFAEPVRVLAESLLHEPKRIQVTPKNTTVDAVDQVVVPVDAARKADLLEHLIREGNWFQVLVFTRTKHGANKLATRLEKCGIRTLAIHGNKSQNARTRALQEFKNGSLQVLVATDIAARGLDIEQLPHVVNFELPMVAEDYVHRIGRTGRAGARGEAISLVAVDEASRLQDIERLTKRPLPRRSIAGFEPERPLPDGGAGSARKRNDARPAGSRGPSHAPSRAGNRGASPSASGTRREGGGRTGAARRHGEKPGDRRGNRTSTGS